MYELKQKRDDSVTEVKIPAVEVGPYPSLIDFDEPPLQPDQTKQSWHTQARNGHFLIVDVNKNAAVASGSAHHPELGLGLLHQIVLLRLADAGEDSCFWVEVQNVALEIR